MSFGIGLGDVIGLVEKAIKIYDKIKDAPNQIERVGYRLKTLHVYLDGLKDVLRQRESLGGMYATFSFAYPHYHHR